MEPKRYPDLTLEEKTKVNELNLAFAEAQNSVKLADVQMAQYILSIYKKHKLSIDSVDLNMRDFTFKKKE